MLSKKGKALSLAFGLLLIAFGAATRLLPHPPNFVPIAALALFGAVYLPRKFALLVPLLAMLISDALIGFYTPYVMFSVYGSFLLIGVLGFWLKKHKKWYTIGGIAFLGAFLFFLLTNFAVWAFTSWYAKSLSGLLQCYLMALPFFKNTLLGDIFYTACFFGIYELAEVWCKRKFSLTICSSVRCNS